MPVSHSVYAAYGVAVAPPRDWEALHSALDAQPRGSDSGDPDDVRVQLFTVGDDHVILATGYEKLEPNTHRAVPSLAVSAQRDGALHEHVQALGLTVQSGPRWLFVHDVS
jgi:lysine/ornithine N-monooxygenase